MTGQDVIDYITDEIIEFNITFCIGDLFLLERISKDLLCYILPHVTFHLNTPISFCLNFMTEAIPTNLGDQFTIFPKFTLRKIQTFLDVVLALPALLRNCTRIGTTMSNRFKTCHNNYLHLFVFVGFTLCLLCNYSITYLCRNVNSFHKINTISLYCTYITMSNSKFCTII